MDRVTKNNIQGFLKDICPVSGLEVIQKPEWTNVSFGRKYRLSVKVIGERIILNQSSGHGTAEDAKDALNLVKRIETEVISDGLSYVHLSDYSQLYGVTLDARKYYVDYMEKQERLLGLIFFGVSPLFKISIKLGQRLNTIAKFKVKIAKDYSEAINLARSMLSEDERKPEVLYLDEASGEYDASDKDSGSNGVFSDPGWSISLDGFSTRFEIIDSKILHSVSSGLMEERHIKHVTELRQKVADSIRPWGNIEYIVAEVKGLKGANRKGRRMYLNSLKEWNKNHPLKMYVFYSANRFMRTAANLARPFAPFKVGVTKDLGGALKLIQREKIDGDRSETEGKTKAPGEKPISTKQVQPYVEELLQYLGSINWETDGFDSGTEKTSIHPFSPVFDAIALIKDELDDLFKERRLAEEALKESEEKFRDLVENITDIIYTIDKGGRITYMSPAIEAVLGYKPDEVIDRSFFELVHKEDLTLLQKRFKDRKYDTYAPEEHRLVSKSGKIRWVRNKNRPILKGDSIIGFRGVWIDITESRRLQVRLQKAQKMEAIGTLAGGVAHDLNNILSGLVSYPDLLLVDLPKGSNLISPLESIKKSGEQAASVVQDLLTLARRGVHISEIIDLNSLIKEYLKSPEFNILKPAHSNVTIETTLSENLLNIKGSPVHLTKTLMNLLSNAAEAMEYDGKIKIKTENWYIDKPIEGYDIVDEGDYVTLTVSDTGVGISREDKERIFEPFYTKKVMGRRGSGLEMAVVWGTVKDHNGYIDLKSSEGKGTRLKLYFPATRELPAAKAGISIEKFMGTGETILVVDDVEEQREIACRMLKKLGYKVVLVSSGLEAVNYMKENSADLVMLDMIMDPGIDGLETYQRILENHPGQKAIIASGFSETDRVKTAQKLGAGAYLKKPYILEEIGRAIQAELNS